MSQRSFVGGFRGLRGVAGGSRASFVLALLIGAAGLGGCSKTISAPTAAIGIKSPAAGQSAVIGQIIQLDGSGSTDPQQRALYYHWSFASLPAGSHAQLNDTQVVNPSFTVDIQGSYVVQLVVSNGFQTSAPATAKVTASNCGGEKPVVSGIVSAPSMPDIGQAVQFTAAVSDANTACLGGGSVDGGAGGNSDGGTGGVVPFAYAWVLDQLPAGSHAALNDRAAANPSFVPDMSGTYGVSLVVTDAWGFKSAAATASITVGNCGGYAPTIAAGSPTASPSSGLTGQPVVFSAAISDQDNTLCGLSEALSYSWSIAAAPAGSKAALLNAATANPSIVPDVAGKYTIQLVAVDSTGLMSAPSTVSVTVAACGSAAPTVAPITANTATPDVGQTVSLTTTASDADNSAPCSAGETFSYSWSIASMPTGSKASLTGAGSQTPWFVPDVPGTYSIQAIATDSTGKASAPASISINASTCGSNAPVISGTPTATPSSGLTGQPVQLSATFTDADTASPCSLSDPLTYAWTFSSLPAGSRAWFTGANTSSPSFVPDVAGTYTATVVATDSTGLSSAPASVSVVVAACGNAAPVLTDITASTTAPNVGQTVSLTDTATDADNNPPCSAGETIRYDWGFVSTPVGSKSWIQNSGSQSPWFTPDLPGSYVVWVVATDSTGKQSAPVTKTITASTCGSNPPVAQVAVLQPPPATAYGSSASDTVNVGVTVQVDASKSTDADSAPGCAISETLTYQWQFTSLPAGSFANLNNWNVANPSFTTDVAGVYKLQVTVSDGTYQSIGTVTVKADPVVGIVVPGGFTVSTVATGPGWNQPMGVTEDGPGGNLYVVQNGNNSVFKITPAGSTSVLTSGGAITDGRYVAYDAVNTTLFLSDGSGALLSMNGAGMQTVWSNSSAGPFGMSLGTYPPPGSPLLAVMASGNGRVEGYSNPIGPAPQTPLYSDNFCNGWGCGGSLWGGWGVVLANTPLGTELFATRHWNNDVLQHPAFQTGITPTTLTSNPPIDLPTDMVFNPVSAVHTNGSLIVANSGNGLLLVIDNCAGGNCAVSVLASGLSQPEGLFLDPSLKTLYVTDFSRNALFKIVGDFTKI